MKQSVIGIFELRRDAVRAREAVQATGIADTDLNLMPSDEIGPEGLSEEELDRYEDAISLLIDEGADQEAQLYMDALRRGSTLLTVTVDASVGGAVDRIKAILKQHNVSELAGDGAAVPDDAKTAAEDAHDQAKGQ